MAAPGADKTRERLARRLPRLGRAVMSKRLSGLFAALLLVVQAGAPLSAAELATLENVALVEDEWNDGDSFKVEAEGRALHLRLYYVDCLETAYGSKADLERMREQQRHFGLEDPRDVARFGEQAAAYVKQVLSRPFTVHTSYARALGRSKTGRFYAFIRTADGQDLGRLLVEQGLARVRGKTRPTPEGKSSAEALEELHDLRVTAMLNRAGIWQATQPSLLVEMRKQQREEARKLKEFQQQVAGGPLGADGPIDLNSASRKELERIPHIGPVTAIKIAASRPYSSLEELLKIPGIGPKTLEAIEPYVTIKAD